MKRGNNISADKAIDNLFKFYGLESKVQEIRFLKHYQEVFGEVVTAYTRHKFIRSGILYIDLVSGAARSQISMNKDYFIARCNDIAKKELIIDIRFI